ncbi:phytoene dehydrogenase [Sistotremastrum niveocremeum HHB9708]|uniref:Phytoene desaturase n=1 Tax=Sistotremastrum niveocremeum HHB9708 TaxID=1314777 RepID=A0A164RS64_9AGAM|nr:phytoene dehydrogenase [Sistotremastrum niveocremeum HHB9708]
MSDKKPGKPLSVVIVGAGVGGVATAARLASAGLKVTVVEKNDFTGGRCSLLYDGGHRFDQGPSLLLLPQLFHTTFKDLGTSIKEQQIELVKCEPNYVVHFNDGTHMRLSTDLAVMKHEIEKHEGKEGFERYLGFLQEAHRHYELSATHVLNRNFTSIFSMLRPSFLRHVLTLHPFESIYWRASKYFVSDRLRRVFTFASMYMGISPLKAPGTYSLLQYTEFAEGIWYPIGGFHRIVEALVNIGNSRGVDYRMGSSVKEVLTSSDGSARASGVVLGSGEIISADLVVINADLVYAYNNLLPKTSYAASLQTRKTSCSSISFYWSMDRVIDKLGAHNIFLAKDYEGSFDQIFEDHAMPNEPSFYVNVPSRIDSTAAPPGKDSIVVLVPVGHIQDASDTGIPPQDWDALVSKARSLVLQRMKQDLGLPDIDQWITHEIVNNPMTWKDRFNLDRGAILGIAHDFFNVLSFRPRTKHDSIRNLYFVGASTHPGTGVPICLAGAKITSEQILSELGICPPWTSVPPSRKHVTDLDMRRHRPIFSTSILLLVASILLALLSMFYGQ